MSFLRNAVPTIGHSCPFPFLLASLCISSRNSRPRHSPPYNSSRIYSSPKLRGCITKYRFVNNFLLSSPVRSPHRNRIFTHIRESREIIARGVTLAQRVITPFPRVCDNSFVYNSLALFVSLFLSLCFSFPPLETHRYECSLCAYAEA